MCNPNLSSLREISCNHTRTVDDYNTGDTVCTECGLCLNGIFLSSYDHSKQSQPVANCALIRDFIADVCVRASIPEFLIDYSVWVYKTLLPQLAQTKYASSRKNNMVAAFAIYESSIRHQVPRSTQEISFFSGVPSTDLWAIERALHDNTSDAPPSQYVERFCQWLGIQYFPHQTIIKEIVDNLYGMRDSRSNCIVATVIHLYCVEHGLNHTLKKICETCAVSGTSVQKLIRKIDYKYVSRISLLATSLPSPLLPND